MATGKGTKERPWQLKTPPGTSEYTMYRDDTLDPPAIVCKVGTTELRYDARWPAVTGLPPSDGLALAAGCRTSAARPSLARGPQGHNSRRSRLLEGALCETAACRSARWRGTIGT